MTTTLMLNDYEAIEKVGIGDRFFNMDSTTQIDIPRDRPATFPIPERIIVRTLDVISSAAGPLGWLQADQPHPCNSLADVADMVAAVREGRYDPRPPAAAYHRPLDLNLSRPTCFIIRLSGSWNWRFSRKAKGASLGPDVDTDPTNYCHLRHVLDSGTEQYPQFDHPDECKIIYFFAKPPAGTPPQAFNNSFNLNIELLFGAVEEGEINSIPIVIDPDIRFPGGSGD